MKLPSDIHKLLQRRFQNNHREWLKDNHLGTMKPLEINLGTPTEQEAMRSPESVKIWISTWHDWQGKGSVVWKERRWRVLGTQLVPEKLLLNEASEVAHWVGEGTRWQQATTRLTRLIQQWPSLLSNLTKHYNLLASYSEVDFLRLNELLSWLITHPQSNLYPRQIPVAGMDSKWLEARKGIISELIATIQNTPTEGRNFYSLCGLRCQAPLIRIRILDETLRAYFDGVGDISAPVEDIANISARASHVFIVENLQTGLAFQDLPGSIVIMGLGYSVDLLSQITWLRQVKCIYWGDIDTHGFAILHRARAHLPALESLLMDETTLHSHRELWVEEKSQHSAEDLSLLTADERATYQSLKSQVWGQQVRLEQERIAWDLAWEKIMRTLEPVHKFV